MSSSISCAGEGVALTGALNFRVLAGLCHDNVEVRSRPKVLFVVQVKQRGAIEDARADRRNGAAQGECLEFAALAELVERLGQGDVGAGDGGGPRPAVRFQDVAIDDEGALAEEVHLGDGAQGTADQTLDLGGPPGAPAGLSRGAGMSRAGQHAVLGGDPAGASCRGRNGEGGPRP